MSDAAAPEPKRWPTVYVETSVISYLAARPSGDLITRGHQQATRRWWANRSRWTLVVSSIVLQEALRGNHEYAMKRVDLLEGIPAVAVNPAAKALSRDLLQRVPLPSKARLDAEHIATAAVAGLDYLVTWNLKHIANVVIRRRIEDVCRLSGYEPPVICTPEQLMES